MIENFDDEEESYFISMTDMMVGMLFIFILLLLHFALQSRARVEEIEERIVSVTDTRTEILRDLQQSLEEVGVTVSIDEEKGLLRLPEQILFERNQAMLKPEGVAAILVLRSKLIESIKCYVKLEQFSEIQAPGSCSDRGHRIEALFVEGHTDQIPFPEGAVMDNWDLSVARAANAYRELTKDSNFDDLKNPNGQPILSVAGYADKRLINDGLTEDAHRQNRRIDLRIIMAPPITAADISDGQQQADEVSSDVLRGQ